MAFDSTIDQYLRLSTPVELIGSAGYTVAEAVAELNSWADTVQARADAARAFADRLAASPPDFIVRGNGEAYNPDDEDAPPASF